jgi:hypothetical protein
MLHSQWSAAHAVHPVAVQQASARLVQITAALSKSIIVISPTLLAMYVRCASY